MSLINDALKRAQEERLAVPGEKPGVPVYQKAPDRGLRREIGVIALLVFLVVVLFGGLVGLLVYQRLRPAPAVAVTTPAAATPAAAGPESPAPSRTPQSRYGKAMDRAKTVAGQVADREREGRETANNLGAAQPAPAPAPASTPAPATAGTPAAPPPAPLPLPPSPPAAPAVTAYKLSGIIGRAPTFTALINGQMVKVRDRVGTAEVITVETTRAVLRQADGKTIELTISGNR